MTKTSAAKRFAETYGVYGEEGKYTLLSTYQPVPNMVSRNRLEAAQRDRTESRKQHHDDLKIVMSLLGVEGQYADTVENVYVPGGAYLRGYYEDRVTKSAVQKFAEDLRTAQSAVEGQSALKRLRKVIKSVTKEESK